jgi:histidinol-phosphate aminotransferase
MNTSERARLVAAFEKLGLSSYPSEANFVAVRVPTTATAAYDALLRQGVIVRSGDGLRLPQYLRITVGRPEENDALLTALEGFLAGVSPDMLVS